MWGSGPLYLPMPPTKRKTKLALEPAPDLEPTRNIRDKEHARAKQRHADDCLAVYLCIFVVLAVMSAAVLGAEVLIRAYQKLPLAPPPPPPPLPPPKNVAAAFVDALLQYFKFAAS